MQGMFILQSETKMKAASGQKVKISLPKAFQTSKVSTKSLAVKGLPTDITEAEFKEFLDLNKISYAKAERLKSKKDGRVLPIFQLEITDPDEAEALISQNLVCNRHSLQGGSSSSPNFDHAVLQLPMFRPLGKNLQIKTKMSDLRRESFAQRMP